MKTSIIQKLCLLSLLCGMGLAACNQDTPTAPFATTGSTTTSSSIPTPEPSATLDLATPENLGRDFLSAWEEGNYAVMYNFISPSLRLILSQENFKQAYQAPLDITTAISITLIPRTLNLGESHASIEFKEIWHTGMFGDLQTNNKLELIQEEQQWWIDWEKSDIWPDLVEDHTFAVEYQIPPRANIYDRNGAGLAIPSTIVTVGVIPEMITDEASVLASLSQVLGMTPEEIKEAYTDQPANWFIPIKDITGDESLAHDSALNLEGIERRARDGRIYPLDGVASHIIGWVSPIPAEEYDAYRYRGYRGDERVGITGLEANYESTLAGHNGGRLYLVGSDGTYIGGITERKPERGQSIHTTIDRDLQYSVEQVLGYRRGAIVALEVNTGKVLALTSGPSYDNNAFIRTTDSWALQSILADPNLPLLNRATQGLYPSGSVFKIVTLATGLEAGGLTAESNFYCPGYWDGLGVNNRKVCWLGTGHGNISLRNGLVGSCNVVFYEVGKILDGLGQDILPTYGKAFGLGAETGLVELRETKGLVPDPDWKEATYHENWGTGDTINLAIGQGYLLVTPLQVARMVAAVANGGTLYRPYIVERVTASASIPELITQPQADSRLPISDNNLAILQDAMHGVTTEPLGTTTYRFQGLDIAIAGKTGTAEPADNASLPHSWFVGYFPADNPQIALVVMLENAGEGSTVAAPMFRQVLETYYGLPLTPLPQPAEVPQGD